MKNSILKRRDFIKTASLASGAVVFPQFLAGTRPVKMPTERFRFSKLADIENPLAIAMWDYSWILRHHRYGEFENWDKVLEELAVRGYNAIRIDAMPQFVAADSNGKRESTFRSIREDWKPALWGNDFTMSFQPREALLEFLPKCADYGIKVGLASWFMRHGTNRKDIFNEMGGLLRAWEETLQFLDKHQLLDQVLYVDLLNEYPNWHGYDWLKHEMNKRSDLAKFKLDNPDANVPEPGSKGSKENLLQKEFYNDFLNESLLNLQSNYPGLEFFTSLDSGMDLEEIDLTHFKALDYHVWFAHSGRIKGLDKISSRDQSLDYRQINQEVLDSWNKNKDALVKWMDGRITAISEKAREHQIICGNTEGWGPIWWFDHPELNWDWVKETAEICVDLCLQHDNYKFICTSNFTHPQFKGMWNDVKWHQRLTSRIKTGQNK